MKPLLPRRNTMRILRVSLVIVKNDNKVLLGLCKRGFNKDKYSGLGGVLQPKEDVQSCVLKNAKEQCGITLEKLEKVGKIEVKFAGVQELLQFHIFISDSFSGEIKETKELTPEWFNINEVPYEGMWQDMTVWMPHVLRGKKVRGFFIYQNEDLIYQDLNTDALFGTSRDFRANNNLKDLHNAHLQLPGASDYSCFQSGALLKCISGTICISKTEEVLHFLKAESAEDKFSVKDATNLGLI